ncbi:hypothetical protein ACWDRB_60465 [Nonomuraea sp. NPDC003707]
MNSLKLTAAEWRILRYLAAHSTTATRVGFRIRDLRQRTGANRADVVALAESHYITGRLHTEQQPYPVLMQTADNPRLRIHLTPAGKTAATVLQAAHLALCHLRARGPLPMAALQRDAGTSDDTVTQLERHGHIAITPGEYLSWQTGGFTFLYGPPSAGPAGCDPCWRCNTPPPHGARIWRNTYGDLYCDPCARHNAGEAPTPLLTLTSLGRRYAEPYTPQDPS